MKTNSNCTLDMVCGGGGGGGGGGGSGISLSLKLCVSPCENKKWK